MKSKSSVERSINISDNITPITHKPILQIHGDMWETMNISQLTEQKNILINRLTYIMSSSMNISVSKQIQTGIDKLQKLIDQKTINA